MKLGFVWDICLWGFFAAAVFMIFFRENALKRVKEYKIGVVTTLITALLLIWCVVSFGGVSTFLYMNFMNYLDDKIYLRLFNDKYIYINNNTINLPLP